MEGIVEEELGREVRISEIKERKGMTGMVLIVRLEKLRDKAKVLEREWEIRRNWGWGWMRT